MYSLLSYSNTIFQKSDYFVENMYNSFTREAFFTQNIGFKYIKYIKLRHIYSVTLSILRDVIYQIALLVIELDERKGISQHEIKK